MLPLNAIGFAMSSPRFNELMVEGEINPDYCLGIKMRRIRNESSRFSYYEMYFDFGRPDLSIKDVVATVKIIGPNEFEILEMKFLRQY